MTTFYGIVPEPMEWRVEFRDDGKRQPLPLCLEHVNHSPDGFAWGYVGSAPAQLAFAILHAYYGSSLAHRHYHKFAREVLARLDKDKPFVIRIIETVPMPTFEEPDWRKLMVVLQ
jgi:hypothetical protein